MPSQLCASRRIPIISDGPGAELVEIQIESSSRTMRTLSELVNSDDPGIDKIRDWARNAANECVLLSPSAQREQVLLQTQVTTRSTMGAIAYETGGILIDGGGLRGPGSRHPR